MVSRAYLLHKPAPPSAPVRVLNQQIIPMLIDAAASVEGTLEEVAIHTRQNPLPTLALTFCAGALLATFLPRSFNH